MSKAAGVKAKVLGDIMTGYSERLNLIATYMYESGVNLRTPITLMGRLKEVGAGGEKFFLEEVWTKDRRYKIMTGRAYGHARKQKKGRDYGQK